MLLEDVPLLISSPNTASERRVTLSWSLAQLKMRLEPVTGIPASFQILTLRVGSQEVVPLTAPHDDVLLSTFPVQPYAHVCVHDTRPAGARPDYTDVSSVEKYVMSADEYEARPDSVLAWKKAQKLGRFDPDAPSIEEQRTKALERDVEERRITLGSRCQLLPADSDGRRGTVSFVGPVSVLPGPAGPWIGITLDEPTGKNDGTANGKRYFSCKRNFGLFVRPRTVQVGHFPASDDMEEI